MIRKNIPHLLIISAVLPFPRKTGQQQRIYYTLRALREHFQITFLTVVPEIQVNTTKSTLLEYCDNAIVLSSRYDATLLRKIWYKIQGVAFVLQTGLKFSNYLIEKVEFTPERLTPYIENLKLACVLYEYWHASATTIIFQERGIPCVLDMHNILWQSYARQLAAKSYLPAFLTKEMVRHYRHREEQAWEEYDALISINAAEHESVRALLPSSIPVFYVPMGTDLSSWPYSWSPVEPPRIAYYGGLGTSHNQHDAFFCYDKVMPEIWRQYPKAEFWLIGSAPPENLLNLAQRDSRVTVTGYVPNIQNVLKSVTAVLCPWSGTYGFRSRIVEVMALGIPVVATTDAVYGMGLDDKVGIFLENTPGAMAAAVLNLLKNPDFAQKQSLLAHSQIVEKFSYEATYGRLTRDLYNFVSRKASTI